MSLLLLLIPFCHGILLPNPSGLFQVSLTHNELVDTHRPDPWNLDTIPNRRIMVSRFDPVSPKKCQQILTVPYMTPIVAAAEDEILEPYGWPLKVLEKIEFLVCDPKKGKVEKAPIVLFSPGMNTTKSYYSALAREVASRGYSVLTIDHPFETDIVEFPDGTIAYGGHGSSRNLTFVEFALDVRAKDISFVLDTLGFGYARKDKAIVFGQSFGGAATAQAMSNDARIRGGVNLDGNLFGPVVSSGFGNQHKFNQSFVMWGAELHNTTQDKNWNSFWAALERQNVWKKELTLKGGAHGSFWDLPLVTDVAGIRDKLGEYTEEDLLSKLPGARVYTILAEYLDDYFKFVLGETKSEGLLSGSSLIYPEVEFP